VIFLFSEFIFLCKFSNLSYLNPACGLLWLFRVLFRISTLWCELTIILKVFSKPLSFFDLVQAASKILPLMGASGHVPADTSFPSELSV
jgi:hypothetical protein